LKVLFDTNIILDVLLEREPFFGLSSQLFNFVESKKIDGYLCATTLTTIDYLVTKHHNKQLAKQAIQSLLALFSVAGVNKLILINAVDSEFSDFEDAVLYQSACNAGIDYIVTRNVKDFKMATSIRVCTPLEYWQFLQNS
jgi:predicted nucleic acid-binding protein